MASGEPVIKAATPEQQAIVDDLILAAQLSVSAYDARDTAYQFCPGAYTNASVTSARLAAERAKAALKAIVRLM